MGRGPEGRFVRRGSPIRASDFNALRRAIGNASPFELHGKLPRPAPISWIGQIMPFGPPVPQVPMSPPPGPPPGERPESVPMPDFADARYWVQEVSMRVKKKLEGPTGPPLSRPDQVKTVHPQNQFDVRTSFSPLPHGRGALAACINLAEAHDNTHTLPWGTIVRVESWDVRGDNDVLNDLPEKLRGTTWNVFTGPASVSLEVKIEKVITNSGDPSGDDIQRELQYLQAFGPFFKVRRLVKPDSPDFPTNPIVSFAQWFVALPMRGIDANKFKAANGAQIYNIDNPAQPSFIATNGARGLTLLHTTCATPLVAAPTAQQLCPAPALEVLL